MFATKTKHNTDLCTYSLTQLLKYLVFCDPQKVLGVRMDILQLNLKQTTHRKQKSAYLLLTNFYFKVNFDCGSCRKITLFIITSNLF